LPRPLLLELALKLGHVGAQFLQRLGLALQGLARILVVRRPQLPLLDQHLLAFDQPPGAESLRIELVDDRRDPRALGGQRGQRGRVPARHQSVERRAPRLLVDADCGDLEGMPQVFEFLGSACRLRRGQRTGAGRERQDRGEEQGQHAGISTSEVRARGVARKRPGSARSAAIRTRRSLC
jgi:hypothetical protein